MSKPARVFPWGKRRSRYCRWFVCLIGRSFGRRGTARPASVFAQYSLGGFGTSNCVQTFDSATSEIPYSERPSAWALTRLFVESFAVVLREGT